MSRRADEIRKRIARRKKEKQQYPAYPSSRNKYQPNFFASDEEKHGVARFDGYDGGVDQKSHPLFQKEWFMFKVLGAACILLIVAIMYKDGTGRFDAAREFVGRTMESEFQFAAVSQWYEDQFGKPLTLLPSNLMNNEKSVEPIEGLAVPAIGRILENFEKNGQGIMIETGNNSSVEAINEGTVITIGKKENVGGITVVVGHSDGSQSWYGNLESTDVLLYDFVEKGTKIGTVIENEDGVNGTFYFALKQGDNFIDPIQVINFE